MSKDTIYREDAIKAINARSNWYQVTCNGKQIAVMLMAKDVNEILEKVPSADRPQGEWIDAEIPLESGDTMPIQVCNLCKTFYPLAYTGGGHRFCPNCGARMFAKDTNVPNKKGADDDRI